MDLVLYFLGLAIGVVILVKSADWFTDASVSVAYRFNVPEIIIGATLVSLATTLPEFAVSFAAALEGKVDMAVGNAVGSTICNIGLILGLCTLLSPMGVARKGFVRSGVGLFLLCLLFAFMGYAFPEGTRWSGVALLACLVVYFGTTVRSTMIQRTKDPLRIKVTGEPVPEATLEDLAAETTVDGAERIVLATGLSGPWIAAYFVLGAVGVVGGSKLVVYCAEQIALAAGISRQIIALTLVALGTSTPELVVSIAAILKKQRGLSIGNIIGANILNLAWVLGTCSLVTIIPFNTQNLRFDIPVMLLMTVLLLVFGFTGERLSRREGAVLLTIYAIYVAVLFTFYRVPAMG
jgi:cation:H+ antiporter